MLFANKFVAGFTACTRKKKTKTDSTELDRDSLMQSGVSQSCYETKTVQCTEVFALLMVVACSMVIHIILYMVVFIKLMCVWIAIIIFIAVN